MRGEKNPVSSTTHAPTGSPPHARGKDRHNTAETGQQGITPACAGKSFPCHTLLRLDKDHPRMRGEKDRHNTAETGQQGSPPHARGKVKNEAEITIDKRITPACAGKSLHTAQRSFPEEDHPRMRGEKYQPQQQHGKIKGSPPHARGKVLDLPACQRGCRITPACAGKSHAVCR